MRTTALGHTIGHQFPSRRHCRLCWCLCAVDTYAVFVDENEELLKSLPPSPVALDYYQNEDLYM